MALRAPHLEAQGRNADRHQARTAGKPFLINFQVEKEDGVYPMIAPGAALHEMVRRPEKIRCLRRRRTRRCFTPL